MGKKFKENKMIEKIGIRYINNHRSYVYKIYLQQSEIFMRIDKTPYYNSERYVIIVDSSEFYRAWTGKTLDQCIINDEWEQKKYIETIEGFSRGIYDPVPLAQVGYGDEISFINGITRTKWLIINGAQCFPLECSRKSAKRIYPKLSYKNTKIENAFRLFKEN
jgi:hypothetical protein